MDSSLKIKNNAIYNIYTKKSKKYNKQITNNKKIFCSGDILKKIDEIYCKINKFSVAPGFVYTNKVLKNNGLFLFNEKYKLVIILKDKIDTLDNGFLNILKKKSFGYLEFNIHKDNIDILINDINIKVKNFEQWLERRGNELNNTVIKSEVWFKKKFVKEPFYDLLGIEYNKSFKKFIYDLFSKKYNLAIEVDGSIHKNPDQISKDLEKNRLTGAYGLNIIRVNAFNEESYAAAIKKIYKIIRAHAQGYSKKYNIPITSLSYSNIILRKK